MHASAQTSVPTGERWHPREAVAAHRDRVRRCAPAAVVVVAVVLGTVLAASVLRAAPAAAAASDEVRMLSLINQVRASVGAPPLTLDPAISAVARQWADTMAARGGISHNPAMGDQIGGWSRLAENVGYGPTLDWVHQALVESPRHYQNLSDPGYSLAGIGVASSGGYLYVAQNFVQPAGGGRPVMTEEPAAVADPEPAPPPAAARSTTPPPTARPDPPAPAPAPVVTAAPPAPPPAPSQFLFVLETLRALDEHNGRR